MEPQPLGMSYQPSPRRAVWRLEGKIARAKAALRRQQQALSTLPPGRHLVASARLVAAGLRLAQLHTERQRLRGGI